jgi:hypothetical protein
MTRLPSQDSLCAADPNLCMAEWPFRVKWVRGPATRSPRVEIDFLSKKPNLQILPPKKQNSLHRALDSSTSSPDKDRESFVNILTPDPSPLKSIHLEEGIWPPPHQLIQVPLESYHQITNGMPSPMDECDHLINIDPITTGDTSILKRKLDGSSEELSFPCKKIAGSPVEKLNVPDVSMTMMTPTKAAPAQPKLTKAERDALKMEKAKEREVERQKKEQEKQKREEERLKKVMYLRQLC